MRAWLFQLDSYKKLLARLMEEAPSPRGIVSRAAAEIGCQRSYLSQVLHGKAQLTRDQAWGLARFFALGPEESAYFEALVDYERAASPAFRRHLEERLRALRKEAGRVAKQFPDAAPITEPEALDYFSHWLPSAVHILTSVPQFQRPERMAAHLEVSLERVSKVLQTLAQKGLVRQEKGRWVFGRALGFVAKESLYVSLHHQNWRQEAVEDSRDKDSDGLHYTMVQSMSRRDFEALKTMVTDFISRTRAVAEPSSPEMLTALNLDFFEPR